MKTVVNIGKGVLRFPDNNLCGLFRKTATELGLSNIE